MKGKLDHTLRMMFIFASDDLLVPSFRGRSFSLEATLKVTRRRLKEVS